jgi:glycosyltransferase involved in cell wall biosynthesis
MSEPAASPFRPSISMLGWAYNEEENIADYIERAGALLPSVSDDYELILMDDGSTDRTTRIASDMQKSRPWLKFHSNSVNRGIGVVIKEAIALSSKDYLFWQTVDWSYDITTMMQNLHLLRHCDILQGYRPPVTSLETLGKRSDNVTKGIISLGNYLVIRSLFWLPLLDYQNITFYPRRLLQSIHLESDSSFLGPEMLLKTWWKGMVFQEVPVPFIKRARGEGKGTRLKAIYRSINDILGWWWQWVACGQRPDRKSGKVVRWEGRPQDVPQDAPRLAA